MTLKPATPLFASLLLLGSLASAAPAVPAPATPETGDFASLFAPALPDCSDAKAEFPALPQLKATKSAFYCGTCSPAVACRGLNVGTPCFGIQKTCQPLIECSGEGPNALRCICSSITP